MEKTLTINNDINELPQLATFIDEIADEVELGMSLVFNLNLALEEAMTNVVLYAYPGQEGQKVTLEAKYADGQLIFVLSDTGVPFNPLEEAAEPDLTLDAEDRPIGGLGVFLVKQLMTSVEYAYADGKNILTMTKDIN